MIATSYEQLTMLRVVNIAARAKNKNQKDYRKKFMLIILERIQKTYGRTQISG